MKDIGDALSIIMQNKNCSSTHALILLSEGDCHELCKLQSKSCAKTCGRLRNKGDIKNAK